MVQTLLDHGEMKKSTTSRESGAFFISSMTRNFAVCEICRALNPPVPAKLSPSSLIQVTRTSLKRHTDVTKKHPFPIKKVKNKTKHQP